MRSDVFVMWPRREQSFVCIVFGLIVIARGKMRRRNRIMEIFNIVFYSKICMSSLQKTHDVTLSLGY